jgi:2-polyprenyl-6-methoxyphenol hydroxylase-like FAD-dependent oxidoreductase
MRVAICGAGLSALALANLLKRQAATSAWQLDLFERGSRHSDQGTSLDLSAAAQRTLKRGGLTDGQYRRISRAASNISKFYSTNRIDEPLLVLAQPRCLRHFLPPTLETNRAALRKTLLDNLAAMNDGECVRVHFDCGVAGIDLAASSDCHVSLLGDGNAQLGHYDLLLDCSGVSSLLRRYRYNDDDVASSSSFTGETMWHGFIEEPESSFNEALLQMLGQGSVFVLGGGGKSLMLQRYGAAFEDKRASLYYIVMPGDRSASGGSIGGAAGRFYANDDADVVRSRLKDEMAALGWPRLLDDAVDACHTFVERPIMLHPMEPSFRNDLRLPLHCIGDAAHVIPPYTGEGGCQAIADADELAQYLGTAGADFSIEGLRALEDSMFARVKPIVRQADMTRKIFGAKEAPTTLREAAGGSMFFAGILAALNGVHAVDKRLSSLLNLNDY